MPSTSAKQHRFMEAVAHNPAFAKKAGVPQSVGQEFSKADKGKTFKYGGNMEKHEMHSHHMKMAHHHLKEAMKHGGHVKKMAGGGITTAKMGSVTAGGKRPHGEHTDQKKGHTKGMEPSMKAEKSLGMKRGGKTHHKK
jgi:hypothetical protein